MGRWVWVTWVGPGSTTGALQEEGREVRTAAGSRDARKALEAKRCELLLEAVRQGTVSRRAHRGSQPCPEPPRVTWAASGP